MTLTRRKQATFSLEPNIIHHHDIFLLERDGTVAGLLLTLPTIAQGKANTDYSFTAAGGCAVERAAILATIMVPLFVVVDHLLLFINSVNIALQRELFTRRFSLHSKAI